MTLGSTVTQQQAIFLGGMSISIAGAPPSLEELAVFALFESLGIPIFQAAPNVGQGYYDWGSVYSDVINVGAWNQGGDGELLVSSFETIPTLDILADGYVQKLGWGDNFGTSFATPKVAAAFINILNSYLIDLYSIGSTLSDLPSSNYSPLDYSDFVTSVVDAISSEVSVTFNFGEYSYPISILTDTIEANGFMPLELSSYSGLDGISVLTASAYSTNTKPAVANAIADQSVAEDSALSFQFASNTFCRCRQWRQSHLYGDTLQWQRASLLAFLLMRARGPLAGRPRTVMSDLLT